MKACTIVLAVSAVESSQTDRQMAEMTDILVCPSLRPSGHFTDLAHKYASFLKFLTQLVVSKSIDLINEKIDATRST